MKDRPGPKRRIRSAGVALALLLSPKPLLGAQTHSDLPPSFRDVSIDLRCPALSGFVKNFAEKNLGAVGYHEIGCSEGNGIGGATYELEFNLKAAQEARAYTIQIALREAASTETKLCLQTTKDTVCSRKFAAPPAKGESHFASYSGAKADAVTRLYLEVSPALKELLPKVVSWVTSEQKVSRIFGTDFAEYVGSMQNKSITVPISTKGKTAFVKVELKGAEKGETTGKAKILSDLPNDIQECLGCTDRQCAKHELEYAFNNRFLSISGRPATEEKGKHENAKLGLAWVLDNPEPVKAGEPSWRFLCGISRYSVRYIRQ